MTNLKNNFFKTVYGYLCFYAVFLVAWEVVVKLLTGEIRGDYWFLVFIPAQAMFLTLFSGWFRKNAALNIFVSTAWLFILWLYYSAQIVYHGNFASFFSVSLIRLGAEAAGNFWWAILSTIRKNIAPILFMLVIGIIPAVFMIVKKKQMPYVSFGKRLGLLAGTVLLWLAAVQSLRLFGTERGSAYYLLNNSYADTDSSAESIGVLSTTVVETGAYLFGINSEADEKEIIQISSVDLELTDLPSVEPVEAISADEVTSEEIFYHLDASLDFEALKNKTGNETVAALCDYFSGKEPEKFNEYTGLLQDHNLIYICVESFSPLALNEKITPLLCEMSKAGFVFNNYYTSYMNTTTNGEFAFATGLWADVSRYAADGNDVGSFARSSDNYMPYGLGNLFEKENVPSFAYHGYIGSYYRRCDSWPNLGFKTIKFMNEGMTFINKYSPSDRELMAQSVDDYINEERFVTYYMTFSGHGSYTTNTYMYLKNNEEVRALLEGEAYSDEEIAYFCGSFELEKAMEYLFERLNEAGKLDNTLIVMASDHVPCSLSDEAMESLYSRKGLSFEGNYEMYHSTLIMYDKGIETPIISDNYCCNVDILPTVLNLLGINYDSRLLLGNDILGDSIHRARLYNGNFITDYVKYNAAKGSAVWSEKADYFSEEAKQRYLDSMILYTENEYTVSTKIVDNDFYGELFGKNKED